jgi:hypothetical protein
MAQGYIQILNLRESNSFNNDTSAINNLAGAGIASDISIFSNNVSNKTTIEVGTFTVQQNYVVLDTNVYQIALSNRTKVSHNGQNLIVVNSNGVDRFRLENDNGSIITPNPSFDIVRDDIVKLSNIKNLIRSGISTDQTENAFSDEDVISVSESTISTAQVDNRRILLEEDFSIIDNTLDKYRFDRTFSIVTDVPQRFDSRVRYRSTITVTNDDSVSLPTTPGSADNAPGIFIASDTDSQRAFSNNNNPWSGTVIGSGYMITSSSKATIASLVLTDPDFESLSTNTVSSSNVVNDYTHKIETIINGETYYLLCSDN